MANKITLLRIVSLPLLVWFLSHDSLFMVLAALATFILIAVTDCLDGYIARSRGEVTGTGKLLDPVADKLLLTTAMLPLIARGAVPAWLGIAIIGREFLVSGLRMISAADQKIIAAGNLGKSKTLIYNIALGFVIGAPILPSQRAVIEFFACGGLVVGLILAVVSAWEYYRSHYPPERPSLR